MELGLPSLPVPEPVNLRTPGARTTSARAAQFTRALARDIAPALLKRQRARRQGIEWRAAKELARPLRRLCEDMGATFLKYGQLVASAESLFGPELASELRATLDTGPSVPIDEVRKRIEKDLGRPIHEVFASIDPVPLGCASLAVVHKAQTRDGRTVAVKVLRPGIRSIVAADLHLMGRFLGPVGRAADLPLEMIVRSLRAQLSEELDLRNEARTMRFFREVASAAKAGLDRVHVPEPFEELSGPNVLTMEFLDGVPVDDLSAIESMGIDPKPVVEEVVKAWFLTALTGGVFHGDVHAGNIMILRDGRIALLDWGIVGRLKPFDLRMFRQTIRGALGDREAVEEVVDDMIKTWLPAIQASADVDPSLVRALMVEQFGLPLRQPFGTVSLADLITAPQRDLTKLAEDSGVEVRSRKQQRKALKESGFKMPDIDRSMILLGKQLAYFERYGKMYLSDIPLLNDERFFGRLVDYEPT